MYRLTDLTDLGSDASFPNGFPKESTSPTSNDGTKYDRAFMNDWFNFFWKCVADAGITPDGNPDNGDSLNQLFDAVIGYDWKEVGNDGGITTFLNGASPSTGPYVGGRTLRYCKSNGGKLVHVEGWYVPPSTDYKDVFTLPSGFIPNQSAAVSVVTEGQQISYDKILNTGVYSNGLTGGSTGVYVNITLPLD